MVAKGFNYVHWRSNQIQYALSGHKAIYTPVEWPSWGTILTLLWQASNSHQRASQVRSAFIYLTIALNLVCTLGCAPVWVIVSFRWPVDYHSPFTDCLIYISHRNRKSWLNHKLQSSFNFLKTLRWYYVDTTNSFEEQQITIRPVMPDYLSLQVQ